MFPIISLLVAGLLSQTVKAQEKSSQWKCDAEAPCIVEKRVDIPGGITCDGGIFDIPGEGADRAAAEAVALANCRKANMKREKTDAKCKVASCHPPSYIGKNKCNDDSECNVDLESGRCDTDLPAFIVDESRSHPLCGCYKGDQRCHMKWVDYRACESDDDCWVGSVPSAHAIARPKALRGRKFQPCKDGESEPKCVAKSCTVKKIEGVCLKGKYVATSSKQTAGPIPCSSDDDCWSSGDHPIARPKALRGFKFRGCKDGENEPKCIEKLCAIRKLSC